MLFDGNLLFCDPACQRLTFNSLAFELKVLGAEWGWGGGVLVAIPILMRHLCNYSANKSELVNSSDVL